MFIPVAIFTENDVDGDAFLLLEEESMRRMIKSEGLLLKFKKAYANLGFNTQKQIPKEPSKPLKHGLFVLSQFSNALCDIG